MLRIGADQEGTGRIVPKKRKRTGNSRKQADARLAAEAARREKHAALVAERAGDPRFVQRVRTVEGYRVTPAAQDQQELADMFQAQRGRFREKFGRDPGPDDPVIFDPDADEPRPLDIDKAMAEMLAGLPGDTPLHVRAALEAMAEVGYFVTDENQHTFSAEEITAWERALTCRYEAHGVAGEFLAEGGWDAGWDADQDADQDEEDGTWGDVIRVAADALELAVGMVAARRDLGVADEFEARMQQGSASGAEGSSAEGSSAEGSSAEGEEPTIAEIVVTVFLGWMLGAREAGVGPGAVLAWLQEAFGEEETMRFFPLLSLLAPETFAEQGLDWTLDDLAGQMGDQLIRGMVALSAAVAATAGRGDARWLRQFDVR
jgi:hypothetical protein